MDEPVREGLRFVENPSPATAALGEILAGFAAGTLAGEQPDPLLVEQSAALMTAAVRLAPGDARLARALVELLLRTGDVDGALQALEHYRNLQPGDVLAQIRYVDLSAEQMELADERLEYLLRISESSRVASEVRAHAAVMASLLLRETLEESRADQMLARAVELDPYNPLILQLHYERLLAGGATRPQRVEALAMLARGNVLQPGVLTRLAEELAAAGLIEPANELYARAASIYRASGTTAPPALLLDAAALQLVADRPQSAATTLRLLDQVTASPAPAPADAAATTRPSAPQRVGLLPLQTDGILLQPMLVSTGGAEPAQAVNEVAQNAANALRYLGVMPLHRALAGQPEPAPPAPPPEGQAPPPLPQTSLPDVVADAQRLVAHDLPAEQRYLRELYAVALSDLAWIDLYYLKQPTADPIMQALEVLVPGESAALVRLRGWQLWRQGQLESAREKLSGNAERDDLSRLGLLLMDAGQLGPDPAADPQLAARAQELLSRRPGGLVGAFLSDALRPLGARIRPADDADQVRTAYAVLPQALFDLLEPEKIRNFYTITADPRTVRHDYGEPMLVNLTIRNGGRYPLTIGADGLLKPEVRIDARVKVQAQQPQSLPAAGGDLLWGTTRLDPGERIEQTVRVDGPTLAAFMAQQPQFSITIYPEVTTNPAVVQTPQGPGYIVGPGGQAYQVARVLDRRGVPLSAGNERQAMEISERMEQLRTGSPLQRLRVAQLLLGQLQFMGAYVQRREQEGVAQQELAPFRELGAQINVSLQRAAGALDLAGDEAAANAWVKFSAAQAATPEARQRLLRELLGADAFEARIVGVLAVSLLAPDLQTLEQLAGPLAEDDADPTVRAFAARLVNYARKAGAAPATQPVPAVPPALEAATQPALPPETQPAEQ